jgi:hypothetical protein
VTTTKKDDEVLGGGANGTNDGAGSLEEVVGGRVIGPGLDAGGGPDDKVVDDKVLEEVVGPRITGPGLDAGGGPDEVVVDGKVLEEVVGPRITGDPFTFTPPSFFGVRTEPGELVDIDYLYDIGGESIFAPQDARRRSRRPTCIPVF